MSYPIKTGITKLEIGQTIKARREYLGISKQQIADLLGLGYRGYDHKEAGRREITSTELAIIARALDVSTDYLVGKMDSEAMEADDAMRYYNGLPPVMKQVAKNQLKALFDAQDKEAKELEPTTHGKKAE